MKIVWKYFAGSLLALLDFIRATRKEGVILASFGCEGFLGNYEGEVRNHFYMCAAGITIGSVLADGSISACPSIRADYTQGNIYKDKFSDVWFNRFQEFRKPLSSLCRECQSCEHEKYCAGGSRHCFDYDNNKQRVCFKDILF